MSHCVISIHYMYAKISQLLIFLKHYIHHIFYGTIFDVNVAGINLNVMVVGLISNIRIEILN